ncbi:hypothetical protein C8J57DRAFT_18719 [Mycena rebaudengoi]|nr:hypothetical protein C8J57DRAFT_18719 [Mycena rebaudengoi]
MKNARAWWRNNPHQPDDFTPLKDYMTDNFDPDGIHLIVGTKTLFSMKTIPLSMTAPRSDVVSYLYRIGIDLKFFLIRGTPGSGKTTLCSLLYNYILMEEPDSRLTLISFWERSSDSIARSLTNRTALGDPIDVFGGDRRRHWVLFDEAQTTYPDASLWSTFLKTPPSNFIIILFASHSRRKIERADLVGTQNIIQPHQRMGMKPTANTATIPGLYFLLQDYASLLNIRGRKPDLPTLLDDFAQWAFHVSNGHIGVIDSILNAVTFVSKHIHRQEISFDVFMSYFSSPEAAFQHCCYGAAFARGLPTEAALKDPRNMAAVGFLLQLLQSAGELRLTSLPPAAEEVHKKGWVTLEEHGSSFTVDFPSPFHRSRLSYLLCGASKLPPAVDAMSLVEFVATVVASFSRNALLEPARHTTGPNSAPSIPEAQWQTLFYLCAYRVAGGAGLWLSPEYGTGQRFSAIGRIDFYVKGTKRWGIEVLRDGDRMEEHLRRFLPGGAYDQWIQAGGIQEYCVLDFRSHGVPRKEYPNHPQLFHILFSDEYRKFEIQNNMLEMVKSGTLLS